MRGGSRDTRWLKTDLPGQLERASIIREIESGPKKQVLRTDYPIILSHDGQALA